MEASWLSRLLCYAGSMTVTRTYLPQFDLKYGCNPDQQPAAILSMEGRLLPFRIVNGQPGYINLLDALNAWALVRELDTALDLPAAASFKHVSPAGAALGVPLDESLRATYEVGETELTDLASAYVRARGADPRSSFGDFIALSRPVDLTTAGIIKPLVSDGLIAPGFEKGAAEILSAKKQGRYVLLEADPSHVPLEEEFREVHGVVFRQKRSAQSLNAATLLGHRVTEKMDLPSGAARDLVLAAIALKYTQSNSVGYAKDGQMIGIGAGQQSRIDCTKLAGCKVDTWWLRQHPQVRELLFRPEVNAVDRTNARIAYLEGDMTPSEHEAWRTLFTETPEPISTESRRVWLGQLSGVSIASDAFFPFRDNLDHAARRGVQYVVQPGGSARDKSVIAAANEHGMVMTFSGLRLFHH